MNKQEELDELRKQNAQFIQHNPAAAQIIPQFRDIYMVKCLEALIGPGVIDLQLEHEHFIAQQVGNIEGMQRKQAILEGTAFTPSARLQPPGKDRFTKNGSQV